MAELVLNNIGGINLYVNPLARNNNEPIRALNVESNPYGAKSKRSGYITYLGTANGSAVTDLFSFYKNDGTTFWTYRNSGGILYYSSQGTAAWAIAGNGTVTAGNHVSYSVLDDTLIIADGSGSTRHTTDGTAFTNTTGAPIAVSLEQYQNRIYAGGTSSDLFYSAAGNAADWATSGTSDSSSLKIPGGGKLSKIFKQNDRLLACKNTGLMYKWDGYSLVDTATELGPTSPTSVVKIEDYSFWLNRLGIYGFGGARPQLISNAIQPQVYNNKGSGVVGTVFNTAPAVAHRFDYLLAVGSITDDFTDETIGNAIIKYDYQKNEFLNWKFANFPTAWHSYKDANGVQQLIFGDSAGQCYKMAGTSLMDNASAIEVQMEFVLDGAAPHRDKKWDTLWAFFNPGNEAHVSVAMSDTYNRKSLKWWNMGDCTSGVGEFRFPANSRSKYLFVKIYEMSKSANFVFYGFALEAEVQKT